jgi:ankyrin repeat protein
MIRFKVYDTALKAAAESGHLDIVDRLLSAGADVNAGAALQSAASCGHLEIVDRLLSAEADVTILGTLDATALCTAVDDGNFEAFDSLFRHPGWRGSLEGCN